MEKKYPIIVPLDLDEEDVAKLELLMKHWNLDEQATLQRCITETAADLRRKDREAGKGKGDGERPRED